jgi:hypothetical protein
VIVTLTVIWCVCAVVVAVATAAQPSREAGRWEEYQSGAPPEGSDRP